MGVDATVHRLKTLDVRGNLAYLRGINQGNTIDGLSVVAQGVEIAIRHRQRHRVVVLAGVGRIQEDLRERQRLPELRIFLKSEVISGCLQPPQVYRGAPGLIALRGAQIDISIIVRAYIPITPVRDCLPGKAIGKRRLLRSEERRIDSEQVPGELPLVEVDRCGCLVVIAEVSCIRILVHPHEMPVAVTDCVPGVAPVHMERSRARLGMRKRERRNHAVCLVGQEVPHRSISAV